MGQKVRWRAASQIVNTPLQQGLQLLLWRSWQMLGIQIWSPGFCARNWPLFLDFQESLLVILCKSFQECPQWISVLELLQGCIGYEPNFIFVMCARMYLWIWGKVTNKIIKCTKIMWLPYLSINWADSLKDTSQWVRGTILLGSVPVFCGISVSIYFTRLFKVQDLPGCPVIKNPPTKAGNTGLIHVLGRSHMLWSN